MLRRSCTMYRVVRDVLLVGTDKTGGGIGFIFTGVIDYGVEELFAPSFG